MSTPHNRVKIVRLDNGTYAVATHDYVSGSLFRLTGRHFCQSESEAMLIAQRFEAQGYQLVPREGGRP